MTSRTLRPPLTRTLAIACVLVLAATAAIWWLFLGTPERRITANFSSAVGIYPGGDVRVLGVAVGTIGKVQPNGKNVHVEFTLDHDVDVPADAGAVLVSPSVVSDRYVQLAPVYRGGPTMEDGAVIPKERTATPVELDEMYRSLNDISKALGPEGANKDGALTELLDTSAKNLDGNGKALADTLEHLGQAGNTLSGNSKELFATVDNLQKFTSMLAANDQQVRKFNTQMAQVNKFLSAERGDLAASMAELAVALGKVETFVRDNRELLHSNVEQLNSVAKVLVKQKAALNESLTNAPLALGNLQNVYNASSGTLDTRANINELNQPPLVAVCKLLDQTNPADIPLHLVDTCKQVQGAIDSAVPLPTPAEAISSLQQGELPPLPLPASTEDGIQVPLQGGGQ
ncbi:MCE family protein [Parasphingorhabdus pacifica]